MARINLHSMQILSAVAASTSLTKAAAELHLTPSAVSKRIAELEARFGTPLLIRNSSGVTLTPAGEIVVRCSAELMQKVADMSREVGDLLSQQQGEIKVMSNTTAILLGLIEDITRFRDAHPGVRVLLSEGGSEETAEAVKSNFVDIGVCVRTDKMSGLAAHPYRHTDLSVVVPSEHPLLSRKMLRGKDLSGYPVVWTPPIRIGGASIAGQDKAKAEVALHFRSFDGVLRSIRDGAGIAVLPSIAVPCPLPADLETIPLDLAPERFEVVVCHDPSIHSDPLKQQLITWLASRHEQHPELA